MVARRYCARRPCGGRRDWCLLSINGEQLQLRSAPRCGGGTGWSGARHRPPGDRGRSFEARCGGWRAVKPDGVPAGRGRALRVALLGCGVVGTEVVRLLREQSADLAARIGTPVELVGIAVRRPDRVRDGVPPELLTADSLGLVTREDVDIVV